VNERQKELIEILEQSNPGCLAVHFSGKVTGQEYQQFIDALSELLKSGSQVSLVLELAGFEFYDDFESARMDLKFGFGEYRHIYRAAFVGDRNGLPGSRVIGPFTRAEEKHFPEGQLEAAFDWAAV
jgi:hypothetical protein